MTHHEKRYRSHNERCMTNGTRLGAVSLGLAGLIAADFAAMRRERDRRNDKAEVISNIRPGDYSVLVVPGYHADGRILAKNFDRHIEHLGATHYIVHPEKGMKIDSYKEAILKARKADGYRPLLIYALSMGALLDAKIASDEIVRSEMGEIKRKVIDSGLSGRGDLSIMSRLGILVGTLLPVTFSTDQVYHYVNQLGLDEEHLDYDPDLVSREEALERIKSTRKVRYAAAKGQLPFMHREDVMKMDLKVAGAEIKDGIIYLSSQNDHLVNTRRSAVQYSKAYGRLVDFRIDPNRKEKSHATGPENPREVTKALTENYNDGYNPYDLHRMIEKYRQRKQEEIA